jgi:anti-sigma B factor antagonist
MPGSGYKIRRVEGVPVLSAPAEIDFSNVSELRRAVLSCIDAGDTTPVVDLRKTTFCDSAGVSQLVQAHRRAVAAGGELRLVVSAGPVRRILAIVGADRVLSVFTSVDEAVVEAPARSRPA